MKQLEKAYFEVRSDLDLLPEVLAWFDQFDHPPLPNSVWVQCQLVLAEGFTNAVRHAHRHRSKDTVIVIEGALQDTVFELKIWDSGEKFDLHNALAKLSSTLNLTAEGGRGLKLMHQVADRLDYIRNPNGQNCLVVTKYFSPTNSIKSGFGETFE